MHVVGVACNLAQSAPCDTEMNHTNFVNESRNIVWLSGYAKAGDGNTILVCQSSNESKAIPVELHSGLKRPAPNAPCEIKCHAVGYRDESGKSWIRLEAIQIKRASVAAVPRKLVSLNALRSKEALQSKDYNPFLSVEQLQKEIRDHLPLEKAAIEHLMEDAAKRGNGRDGFINKAILSGCVGFKAYIPPADDGSFEMGHVAFHLMQSKEPEKALMVRIQGADGRFSKQLRPIIPVNVLASIGVEVIKDDAGNVTARRLYLSTDKNNVGVATAADFSRKVFPTWWLDMTNQYFAAKEAQRRQAGQVAQVPVSAPVLGVAKAGAATEQAEEEF